MNMPKKRDANIIFDDITPCLPMSEVYKPFTSFIDDIMEDIEKFKSTDDFISDIERFILSTIDANDENASFIDKGKSSEIYGYTVLLSIMGISREKMKNVVLPNYSKLKCTANDIIKSTTAAKQKRRALAELLYSGSEDDELIALFNGDFTITRFKLNKYSKFSEVISNKDAIRRFIEDTYISRVNNKKGYSTEKRVIASVVKKLGLTFEAGKVPALEEYFERADSSGDTAQRNPLIDLVIPSLDNPIVMIESTYELTTASGQTKKADANDELFKAIKRFRELSDNDNILFINFIDGAGWKARGKADVSRFVSSCDYAINYKNLDLLEKILKKYQEDGII